MEPFAAFFLTIVGGLGIVGIVLLMWYDFLPVLRSENRYLKDPLPRKRRYIIIKALKMVDTVRRTWYDGVFNQAYRDQEKVKNMLNAISRDLRRYYAALDGRPDINLVFIRVETFVTKTVTNYHTLMTDFRYADKKAIAICTEEIAEFANYAYKMAERVVAQQLSGTYGAIELREEERAIDRELDKLTSNERTAILSWVEKASRALVRKAP